MVHLAAIPYPTRSPGSGSFAHILLPDRSCSSGRSMLFLMVPLVIVGWHEENKTVPVQFQTRTNSTMREK